MHRLRAAEVDVDRVSHEYGFAGRIADRDANPMSLSVARQLELAILIVGRQLRCRNRFQLLAILDDLNHVVFGMRHMQSELDLLTQQHVEIVSHVRRRASGRCRQF